MADDLTLITEQLSIGELPNLKFKTDCGDLLVADKKRWAADWMDLDLRDSEFVV